ncbi:hypothetical protein SSS_03464 [Sarcoptes scabiei]|nr:hypothetical protein SSS_03464 [Sarcoptes scabiei]
MFSRTKLQFRNDIDGLHYCLMLPLIGWITERSSSYQEANANQWLMSYVFLNATIVLLEFRFNCNAFQKIVHQILFFLVIASQWYHFNWFRSILSLSSVLISNFLLSRILRSIPVKYFKSFTFAEFSIVFQSFIYFLFKVIQFEIYSSINVANISRSEIDLIINDTFSILLISSIISTFLCHSNTFKPFIFLIGIPTCVYTWLSLRLKTHLIRWLWNYLNETEPRRRLSLFWSLIILLTLSFAFLHWYFCQSEYHSGTKSIKISTRIRKIFHLSITLIYITGIKYDPFYLDFASKLILFIFIYVEVVSIFCDRLDSRSNL